MEMTASYGQFCPVAMAAEIFCTRWTPLILRELLCGTRRFNDLRKGVPRMSPSLLSKRLKELEQAGVVETVRRGSVGTEYRLTAAGEELRGIVMALGKWGHRWVDSQDALRKLDPSLLMWDMRRNLTRRRCPRAASPSASAIRSSPRASATGSSLKAATSISARRTLASRSISTSRPRCAS